MYFKNKSNIYKTAYFLKKGLLLQVEAARDVILKKKNKQQFYF